MKEKPFANHDVMWNAIAGIKSFNYENFTSNSILATMVGIFLLLLLHYCGNKDNPSNNNKKLICNGCSGRIQSSMFFDIDTVYNF